MTGCREGEGDSEERGKQLHLFLEKWTAIYRHTQKENMSLFKSQC